MFCTGDLGDSEPQDHAGCFPMVIVYKDSACGFLMLLDATWDLGRLRFANQWTLLLWCRAALNTCAFNCHSYVWYTTVLKGPACSLHDFKHKHPQTSSGLVSTNIV